MNWIKKLFSANAAADQRNGAALAPDQDEFRDLFVADQAPAKEEKQPEKEAEKGKGMNALQRFLHRTYYQDGYNDGYRYHSHGVMEARVRSLKADFRELVEELLEKLEQELHQHQHHLAETKEFGEEMTTMLEQKILQIRERIGKLTLEKDLSTAGEGLINKPLAYYQEGFYRGLKAYQNEQLLNSDSGLFN